MRQAGCDRVNAALTHADVSGVCSYQRQPSLGVRRRRSGDDSGAGRKGHSTGCGPLSNIGLAVCRQVINQRHGDVKLT